MSIERTTLSDSQKNTSHRKDKEMWLDRILESKKEKGITTKSMAEYVHMSERTIARILSGKTQAPYIDTVIALGASVGLSPKEIFYETGVVVGDQQLAILQAEVDRLTNELATHITDAENLKSKISALTVENDLLRLKLEHKEEIIRHKDDIISLMKAKPRD
jgi:transcriptional regulator with XRE-family HTH domain